MANFRQDSRLTAQQRGGSAVAVKRYVLRRRVVTLNAAHEVIADGSVCVADDTIVHVGRWSNWPPVPFDAAPLIATAQSAGRHRKRRQFYNVRP